MQQKRHWIVTLVLLASLIVTTLAPSGAVAATADERRTPVILIPGIAGTELFNKNELVWLNSWRLLGTHLPGWSLLTMNWLLPLRLASDGAAPYRPDYQIRTGDLLRHGLTDAYSGMIGALEDQGYVEGEDLRLLPYDWRKDPSLAADQLGRLVDQTLAETGADQVILIGHSLGGLIARDYVVRGGATKVKASIALATPWLGAPSAYRALEWGWDLGLKLPGTRWAALAPKDVKLLVQNYPSVYRLAPSRQYFDWYPEGYITRGGKQLSYAESVEQGLAPHNALLARQSAAYTERLLDGSGHGVMQFLVAGTGEQTLGGFTERRGWLGLMEKVDRYAEGDGVVPLYSADLGFSKDPARAVRAIGPVAGIAYVQQPHTLFAQSKAVQEIVTDWVLQVQTDDWMTQMGKPKPNKSLCALSA